MADYQLYYITVPISDLENKPYGYVVISGYLLNEAVIKDGSRKYEVVPVKDVTKLNIENYTELLSQIPQFEDGRCVNSIVVDEIYQMYDEAQEGSKARSLKVFEKKAKEESYARIDLVKDLYAYKKMTDEKLSIIRNEREINLSEIEKSINNQKKRF